MGTEIIDATVTEASVPAIADDTLIAVAEQAEKRITAMLKIKSMSLKVTNPNDWIDQGGKPYLQVSGAEKVGRLFGISWRIDEPVFESEEGGHFSYTYKGYFTLGGSTIEAIGTRASKDGFFRKYDNGIELPPSAIDKGDVKKSAYTNLLGNGITRILGMRNLTWSELAEAGIKQEEVQKVNFKEKGKAKEKIASEGANSVEAFITDIRQQTKKNDGTPMKSPLFKINAEGTEYKTFDTKIAEFAKKAKEETKKVKISFITGKYGNNIDTITLAELKEPGERQSGQEG